MAEAKLAAQLVHMRQRRTGPLILELDLTDGIAEGPPSDPVSALLTMRRTRLQDLLDGLKRAAGDDRVRALVVKVGGSGIGLAKVQELRAAIGDFRKSGKLAVAWSESFGEFVRGNVPYYLATGFDKIYLQPSGTLGLTGIAVEQVFLHGMLEKLGIDFQSARRYEYKSATEQLTESGFTGPSREAMARLADSVTEQLIGAIAAGRGMSVAQATELLARGPFLASQALDAGLVDGLMYRDEIYGQARKEAGPDATLLYLQRYQRTRSLSDLPRRVGSSVGSLAPGQHERFVATVYAHGTIRHGRSGRNGPGGGQMGSDTVAAALRAAGSDEGARAVVLRVNSPGGSYTASDVIWREVVRLRAAGKPVVVSMGDVAASGGYFISVPADVIVVQPGTITGSIGVFMGKPVLRELFGRAGVTTDSITDGAGAARATMFSSSRPFSEAEWERINEWLDAVYADFTEKVASGRRLPAERVHDLARGRVWTGADAVANGLADEVGGLREAVATARKRAGLPDDAPVRVYPRLGPLDQLRPAESSEARPAARARLSAGAAGASALAALFADGWGPAWRFAAAAGLPPYGPLTLPGTWTIS
ncbi:MAG TPA: signal peptide peptidase SppA [Trebonia sp.]|nr:signal peptide peptidase SppA [Trebonia sp.]